jgi:hypothetical protein
MVQPTHSNDWKKSVRHNGFILTELIVSLGIILLLWQAFLPVLVQTIHHVKNSAAWEELSRQGLLMDETIYYTLRFSQGVEVSETKVTCYDSTGLRTGFSVKNGLVYRHLNNGQEQPLTGNSNEGGVKGRFSVSPYEGQPYFSKEGDAVVTAMVLQDTVTQAVWPCIVTVVPLGPYWEAET